MSTEITKDSSNSFSFATSRNFEQALAMAKVIANSDLVPKDYRGKPENVLVAIEMGKDLGLQPMQAIQNIAVINGRPSLWGDAMLAVVQGHSDFEYIDEKIENGIATCLIKRKGKPEVLRTFSEDDARLAKLLDKDGPWKQYRKRMLQLRARSFAIRDSFADALKGIHMAEEASDYTEQDGAKVSNARKAYAALSTEFKVMPSSVGVVTLPFVGQTPVADITMGSFDDGKSMDVQTLEEIVINQEIPETVVQGWYAKAGVDSITDMKHETIKALIKKHIEKQ